MVNEHNRKKRNFKIYEKSNRNLNAPEICQAQEKVENQERETEFSGNANHRG